MTLNDFERRNNLYFAFFSPNSTDFAADYITVVEDRAIMSVKYCLPVQSLLLAKTITHPAAWSLCDSWTSSYFLRVVSQVTRLCYQLWKLLT